MAITQIISTLPAVLNDSETFYEDIAERNNSLVTTVLPSINAWATQANTTQTEINAKALQVASQAVDGGYSQNYINDNFFSQNYINDNFIGVNNAQDITEVKTFIVSPIVPTPTANAQAANKKYVDDTSVSNLALKIDKKQDAIGDADLILTGGLYSFSASLSNRPSGSTVSGTLIVNQGVDTSARSQILIDTVDRMWIRYGDSDGWNSWNEVTTIDSFTQLLATEGYAKLPNGLIFQWGVTATGTSGTETFPIVFPNACFGVQIANNSTNSSGFVSSFNKTSFVWANSTTVTNHYLAIGN